MEEEEERCCRKALHSATQAFEFQTSAERSRRASGEGGSVELRRGESFRGLHPASRITAGAHRPRSLECERAKPNQWETSDCACIEQVLPARTVHAKSFHSRTNSAIQIVVPVGFEAVRPRYQLGHALNAAGAARGWGNVLCRASVLRRRLRSLRACSRSHVAFIRAQGRGRVLYLVASSGWGLRLASSRRIPWNLEGSASGNLPVPDDSCERIRKISLD